MKKFVQILSLFAFLLPFTASAEDLTIGTGSDGTYNAPFNNYYGYSWSETVYPASSFTGACKITSVSYNCQATGTLNCSTLKIYMGYKSASTYSSTTDWTPESELTLVYSGTDVTIGSTTGWRTFKFLYFFL